MKVLLKEHLKKLQVQTSEKEKIKKIYQKKIQSLIKLNKAYFQKDNPIIADSEYDELKKELSSYIKKYPYLKQIKNLDTIVGSKPSKKFINFN